MADGTALAKPEKITIRDVWIVFYRWWFACEMANSYERMQALAYCFAMIPALKKLYPDKQDFIEALQRHLQFFNTEGLIGTIILGLTVAMEEEKAETGQVPGEAIVSMKTALMGPLAGVGDSIDWGTVKPLIYSFGLTASQNGSVAGWFILWAFPIITGIYSWYLMYTGYKMGRSAISKFFESGIFNRIITGATIVGLTMVGAMAAGNVSFSIAGSYMDFGTEKTYQSVIDGIIPGLFPLLAVLGVYAYFKKRGQKFGRLVLFIVVISLILSLIGIV